MIKATFTTHWADTGACEPIAIILKLMKFRLSLAREGNLYKPPLHLMLY